LLALRCCDCDSSFLLRTCRWHAATITQYVYLKLVLCSHGAGTIEVSWVSVRRRSPEPNPPPSPSLYNLRSLFPLRCQVSLSVTFVAGLTGPPLFAPAESCGRGATAAVASWLTGPTTTASSPAVLCFPVASTPRTLQMSPAEKPIFWRSHALVAYSPVET
jgi:hypothetical protein